MGCLPLLLAQGDTLLHFMDAADAELRLPVAQVPLLQMQSLLSMGEQEGPLLPP